MGCINKPITIPKGADGTSCKIAFASDSSGTGFSYVQSAALQYMSVVCKTGSFAASDFTIWVDYIGIDGDPGDDGVGISNVFVSDGTTAIGGIVYTVYTIVTFMTNGAYINAGTITTSILTWENFVLVNGWTTVVNDPAQYVLKDGWLYTRGVLTQSAATDAVFTNLTMGIVNSVGGLAVSPIKATISDGDLTTPVFSKIELSAGNTISVTEYGNGNGTWILDTTPNISIR